MNFSLRIWGAVALGVAAPALSGRAAPAVPLAAPVRAIPAGLVFTLQLPPGKTSFRQGESIPITLSFVNNGPTPLRLGTYHNRPGFFSFAAFSVTPREGAVDLWNGGALSEGGGYSGAEPPKVPLSTFPTEETLNLLEFYRFERTGDYQVTATTKRVEVEVVGAGEATSFFGGNRTVTSTPVTVHISPPDSAFAAGVINEWRSFWRLKDEGRRTGNVALIELARPANDIRFLGTREAEEAIINRLGDEIHPGSSISEEDFFNVGFRAFPDSAWLMGAMEQAAKRPDYPITPGWMNILRDLRLRKTQAGGKNLDAPAFAAQWQAINESLYALADEAVDQKSGKARVMTLYTLANAASDINFKSNNTIARRAARLTPLIAQSFNDLPPDAQESLLMDHQWPLVRSSAMAAPLLTKWNELTANRRDTYDRVGFDFPTQVLSRLTEVEPQQGRALILSEMQQPQPMVLFRALSLLPDKTLPVLEPTFLGLLQSPLSANQQLSARLIERYATRAIAPQVRTLVEQRQLKKPLFPGAKDEVAETLRRFLERAK